MCTLYGVDTDSDHDAPACVCAADRSSVSDGLANSDDLHRTFQRHSQAQHAALRTSRQVSLHSDPYLRGSAPNALCTTEVSGLRRAGPGQTGLGERPICKRHLLQVVMRMKKVDVLVLSPKLDR
mmetsp:Transcript_79925/g.239420  ORF Transcript_79925/g.239420 Transcript_79925/m.239420 type:complete len:124 (+) Transcript_79925:137-508(+)